MNDRISLAAYQPLYYKDSSVMTAINTAIENELMRLFASAYGILTEMNVSTSIELLPLWESSVGLAPDTGLPIEIRRSRVLARLRQLDTTTPERVRVIAEAYAHCYVEVAEDFDGYSIAVKFVSMIGKPDDMPGLIEQLERIIPAHIVLTYKFRQRTWGEVYDSRKSWNDLYGAGYTWRDILERREL